MKGRITIAVLYSLHKSGTVGSFKRAWIWVVFAFVVGLSFTAKVGAFDIPAALIGEWRETSGGEILKVLRGGEVILDFSGFSVKGQYEFIDFDRVRFESLFGTMVYSVQLADATLRLVDDRNNARVYEKQIPGSDTAACPPPTTRFR